MTSARPPAAAASQVAAVLAAGGPELSRLLDRTEERLAEVARGHGALAEHAGATLAAGGKRLRPILVFLCGGDAASDGDRLVAAAAAVELLHMATLVHDDVLDRATLRRGRPTVVAAGGRPAATTPATCCSRGRSRSWRRPAARMRCGPCRRPRRRSCAAS